MPAGVEPTGYRAPSFSIDARTPWAHRVLAEEGYAYSSSVAPIAPRPLWLAARRRASPTARSPDADLIELPVTTVELAGRRLAAGGGGFFRLLPYRFSSWAIAPGQPRASGGRRSSISIPGRSIRASRGSPDAPLKSRLRHYSQLSAMRPKLLKLLKAHRLGPHRRGGRSASGRGCHERLHARSPRSPSAPPTSPIPRNAPGSTPSSPSIPTARSSTARNGAARSSAAAASARIIWSPSSGGALRRLPAAHRVRSRLFGNALVSAGFGTGGGILADDGAAAEAAGRRRPGRSPERLGCAERRAARRPRPRRLGSASDGVYADFAADLPGDDEAILAVDPAPPARRGAAGARASASTSGRAATAADRDAHFRVYAESVRNLGTPVFPRALFDAMLDEFGDDADIVTVWKDGRPLASVLNFYFKGVCPSLLGRRHLRGARTGAPTSSSISR